MQTEETLLYIWVWNSFTFGKW